MEKKPLVKKHPKVSREKKKNPYTITVYNKEGKAVDSASLPKEIFGEKENKNLISLAARVYLDHEKVSTASTKTRTEVSGGGRKPWRQKGTGRARAGSTRSPIWRGGGIVFGPKPRNTTLRLPKKMKKRALATVLSGKFSESAIVIVDKLGLREAKTKKAIRVLEKLPTVNKKNILIILENENQETIKSFRNLENVKITKAVDLSTLDVLKSSSLIFTLVALERLKGRFDYGNSQNN